MDGTIQPFKGFGGLWSATKTLTRKDDTPEPLVSLNVH